MSVQIWIQTIRHLSSVSERILLNKVNFEKVSRQQQEHEKLPSMLRVNTCGLPYMNTFQNGQVSKGAST